MKVRAKVSSTWMARILAETPGDKSALIRNKITRVAFLKGCFSSEILQPRWLYPLLA
jgi:hypothetical protein